MDPEDYPYPVARRISRLRWTAGLLWLAWSIAATAVYTVHRLGQPSMDKVRFLVLGSALLGLGALWFVYMIWRIGQLADQVER